MDMAKWDINKINEKDVIIDGCDWTVDAETPEAAVKRYADHWGLPVESDVILIITQVGRPINTYIFKNGKLEKKRN